MQRLYNREHITYKYTLSFISILLYCIRLLVSSNCRIWKKSKFPRIKKKKKIILNAITSCFFYFKIPSENEISLFPSGMLCRLHNQTPLPFHCIKIVKYDKNLLITVRHLFFFLSNFNLISDTMLV